MQMDVKAEFRHSLFGIRAGRPRSVCQSIQKGNTINRTSETANSEALVGCRMLVYEEETMANT